MKKTKGLLRRGLKKKEVKCQNQSSEKMYKNIIVRFLNINALEIMKSIFKFFIGCK